MQRSGSHAKEGPNARAFIIVAVLFAIMAFLSWSLEHGLRLFSAP